MLDRAALAIPGTLHDLVYLCSFPWNLQTFTMAACAVSSFAGARLQQQGRAQTRSRRSVVVSAADRTLWLPGEQNAPGGIRPELWQRPTRPGP